jgi:exodeoxyribonuclease VII small subunit
MNDPKEPSDYETATARLDEIISRLDSGDAQLRETLDLCAEAKTLIEYCATELAAVDEGLKELRLEDLAASLQGSGTTAVTAAGSSAPPESHADSGASYDEPPPEEPPF